MKMVSHVRWLVMASTSTLFPIAAAAQVAGSDAATQSSASAAADASQPPDQDDGGLRDIIVTAQKRSENLQRVPIAITAIDGAQLTTQGVRTTAELGKVAPGLNIRTTNSAFQPTIRGIGTSATFAENPTSLYIDGVYIPQQVGALRELNDIAPGRRAQGSAGYAVRSQFDRRRHPDHHARAES